MPAGMLRKLTLAGLAGLALAAAAVPATARSLPRKIVLYKTVAGVPLGLTPDQVKHRLGTPSHTIRVSGKIAELDFDKVDINVEFDTVHHPDLSDFIAAHGSRYHTAKGIHPDSTVKALKRAYKGQHLKCQSGLCTLYQGHPGATGSRRTDFGTFEGKVEDIDIQVVLTDF
jgi:hypothetical protein